MKYPVVDAKAGDVTKSGKVYDVIFDVAAFRSFYDYLPILSPTGSYVMAGGDFGENLRIMLRGSWAAKKGQTITGYLSLADREKLVSVQQLLASGQIKPHICRSFPLEEASAALRYVDERHSAGKVIVDMEAMQGTSQVL
jgi:NADPH:quinone reductase-like Zn-dependent oxidoreductase